MGFEESELPGDEAGVARDPRRTPLRFSKGRFLVGAAAADAHRQVLPEGTYTHV